MTIQHFADTDTALIDLRMGTVPETREISENLYVDIDSTPWSIVKERVRRRTR